VEVLGVEGDFEGGGGVFCRGCVDVHVCFSMPSGLAAMKIGMVLI
jgi:hypothetical protein